MSAERKSIEHAERGVVDIPATDSPISGPLLTASVARMSGIGRVADLVPYCTVVVLMIGFLMVYARLRLLRRDLMLVVSHPAVLEADGPRDAVSDTPDVAPDE